MNKSNERCIFIHTCGRSGHHAVINWLQKQWPGESYHHNHVFKGWSDQKLLSMHDHTSDRGITSHDNGSGGETLRIYSIEDLQPCHFYMAGVGKFPMFKEFSRVDVLWHVRDPFNWIASSVLKDGMGAKAKSIVDTEGYERFSLVPDDDADRIYKLVVGKLS